MKFIGALSVAVALMTLLLFGVGLLSIPFAVFLLLSMFSVGWFSAFSNDTELERGERVIGFLAPIFAAVIWIAPMLPDPEANEQVALANGNEILLAETVPQGLRVSEALQSSEPTCAETDAPELYEAVREHFFEYRGDRLEEYDPELHAVERDGNCTFSVIFSDRDYFPTFDGGSTYQLTKEVRVRYHETPYQLPRRGSVMNAAMNLPPELFRRQYDQLQAMERRAQAEYDANPPMAHISLESDIKQLERDLIDRR